MDIVLVHGIWDQGRVFRRMTEFLNERGHTCYAPDLIPADGSNGLVDLAEKLRDQIQGRFSEKKKFALIGFSMGTLVSRYYLQRLGGLEQASHFLAISGPQRGTLTAHVWPGKAARDMRFGSRFLNDLNSDLNELLKIPVKTYRTPADLMIIPASSSTLEGAKNQTIWSPFHHLMLTQEKLFDDLVTELESSSSCN